MYGPSDGMSVILLPPSILKNVISWIQENHRAYNITHNEKNIKQETEIYGFKITTDHTSDCTTVSFSTDMGTLTTTYQQLNELYESHTTTPTKPKP